MTAHNEPIDAEDRADIAVLEAAFARGYRVSVQCTCCGHWLSNPKSVSRFLGPKCAVKAVAP